MYPGYLLEIGSAGFVDTVKLLLAVQFSGVVLCARMQSGSIDFLARQAIDFNKVFRDGQSSYQCCD